MAQVIIGVDPHKLSATIEVVDARERLLGSGRFTTDRAGYSAMRRYVSQFPDRIWAIKGANGAGRPLAQRLVEAGEPVLDVPAKLAARARLLDTGHNRKTDALDAHSIAVVAVRTPGLRVVARDGELEALRMLVDRRDELARLRVQTVNRLQRLLSELVPGHYKRDLSALQAKAILATVRPRDIAGKTRRRMAAEEIADLVAVDAKLKKMKAELKAAVLERGSTLMDIHGIGPAGAARILADVGDIARFADRNRFASWTGTAPLDASSGEQIRHRRGETSVSTTYASTRGGRLLSPGALTPALDGGALKMVHRGSVRWSTRSRPYAVASWAAVAWTRWSSSTAWHPP